MKLFRVKGLCLFGLLCWAPLSEACILIDMRFSHSADRSRLVLDLKEKISYSFEPDSFEPANKSAELLLSDVDCYKQQLPIPNIPIPNIKGSYFNTVQDKYSNDGSFSLSVRAKPNMRFHTFYLPPDGNRHHRIVIDILPNTVQPISIPEQAIANRETLAPKAKSNTAPKQRTPLLIKTIITIDAGHGGADNGAISTTGGIEKYINLAIAKVLYGLLDANPRFEPKMVRDSDRNRSLDERTAIARSHKSDVLISIHADAFINDRSVSGPTVYALSAKGATRVISRQSQAAQAEPFIDDALGSDVKNALLNLSMRKAVNRAIDIGDTLLHQLAQVAPLHSNKVRRARFVVLRPIEIPSLLVEVGFLSHPKESQQLVDADYQIALAKAIALGLDTYFRKHPKHNAPNPTP